MPLHSIVQDEQD
jgi:hypothetical protein